MASTQRQLLDALDASVDRIRDLIPPRPYLQSIPQDESPFHPNHHYYEAARVWRGQAPFGRDERPDLQYQTFFYQEHGATLIHLSVQSPPLEPQGDYDTFKEPSRPPKNPNSAGPKKKISLADYKTQKSKVPAGDIDAGGDKRADGGKDSKLAPSTVTNARVPSPRTVRDLDAISESTPSSLKRKRSSDERRRSSPSPVRSREQAPIDTGHDDLRPRKQHRADENAASRERRSCEIRDRNARLDLPRSLSPIDNPMPGRLSPLDNPMPGRLSPLGHILPERLSPDLPAIIIEELDRRARARVESDFSKLSTDSTRQQPVKHDSVMPDARSGRVGREAKAISASSRTSPSRELLEISAEPSSPSLIVRFRIPKHLRRDVKRLLQSAARPDRSPLRSTVNQEHMDDNIPNRPQQSSQHDTSYKHKTAKSQATPTSRSPRPPTPSTTSKQATSMTRMASTDSHKPSTPATQPIPPSTIKPSPTSTTHRPTPTSSAWSAEATRLLSLGKTLKQAGQAHMSSSATELGVLTHIEALCAFILSYHCTERSQLTTQPPPSTPSPSSVRATWSSLHAYWKYLHTHATRWPSLRHLVAALGHVYLTRILRWTPSASSSSSSTSAGAEQSTLEVAALLSRIAAAGPYCTTADLRARWPETWRKALATTSAAAVGDQASAETDAHEHEHEHGRPGDYAQGPLEVFIGPCTPAVVAVRSALSMLAEWKVEGGRGPRFEGTFRL